MLYTNVIYKMSNDDIDGQVLSKIVEYLARTDNYQEDKNAKRLQITMPKRDTKTKKDILIHFKNNPIQKMTLNSKSQGSTDKKDILTQFLKDNPESLIKILSNPAITDHDISNLKKLLSGKNGPNGPTGPRVTIGEIGLVGVGIGPTDNIPIGIDTFDGNIGEVSQISSNKKNLTENGSDKLVEIERELRKLVDTDIVLNRAIQIKFFELNNAFRMIKSENSQLKKKIAHLKKSFTQLKKICLHSPVIKGYVSDGNKCIGIIDVNGRIDYIGDDMLTNNSKKYVAMRKQYKYTGNIDTTDIDKLSRIKDVKKLGRLIDLENDKTIGIFVSDVDGSHYMFSIKPTTLTHFEKDLPILAETAPVTNTQKSIQSENEMAWLKSNNMES